MPSLTDMAGDEREAPGRAIDEARKAWSASMLRRMDTLRAALSDRPAKAIAACAGATLEGDGLRLVYWGEPVVIRWSDLEAQAVGGLPCSTFDQAMLLYYLNTADGTSPAGRWIGFRELPDGAFYNQAFQGYSGARLARAFGEDPGPFHLAARSLGGETLSELAPHAYAFHPLPRVVLAAALWPGDEEFPAQGSVLFDAAASHYLPTDGLALLGAGLVGRLLHQEKTSGGEVAPKGSALR